MDRGTMLALFDDPRVVGVFWGTPAGGGPDGWILRRLPDAEGGTRGGRPTRSPLAFVEPEGRSEDRQESLSPRGLLEATGAEFRVEEAAPVEPHTFSAGTRCEPPLLEGGFATSSAGTVSGIVGDHNGAPALALLAGHAAAPRNGDTLVVPFSWTTHPAAKARITEPTELVVDLMMARVDGSVDAAIVRLPADSPLDLRHPVTGARPPWNTVGRAPSGTPVRHHSRRLNGMVAGTVRAGPSPAGLSAVRVQVEDRSIIYEGVWVVTPSAGSRFSAPGDSGSMVFAGAETLGTVVAGDSPSPKGPADSYVLPARALLSFLGLETYQRFFAS